MFRKRCVALMLSLLFILSLGSQAYAANGLGDEDVELQYIVTCPYGGRHPMLSIGKGNIYGKDPNDPQTDIVLLYRGFAYQCELCCLVLITQNSATQYPGIAWGMYCTQSENDMYVSGLAIVKIHTTYTSANQLPVSYSDADPYVLGFDFGGAGVGI